MIIKNPPRITNKGNLLKYIEVDLFNWMKSVAFALTRVSEAESTETTTIISTGSTIVKWNTVTSANNVVQIVANNGYICSGVSQVEFILPLAPTIGDTYIILSATSTFIINQNGSQSVRLGAQISTAGSGNLKSNTVGDSVQFYYIGSNLFLVTATQGTITVS